MSKTYKLYELCRKLREHDPRFQLLKRGKGSERQIYHPDIGGQARSFPIKCHGVGNEIRKGYYPHIKDRFNLPEDFFKD